MNGKLQTEKPAQAHGCDHVARLVHAHFGVENHELCISGVPVSELLENYGSPLFVYDGSVIEKVITRVKTILPPTFDLYYSMKANPNASILKLMLQERLGLEVASGGELFQALQAGCPPERIIFAGPGKSAAELSAAVSRGIREVHIESPEEAATLSRLAAATGTEVNVALRVNPVDAAGGAMRMGGRPSQFGIDEEDLERTVSIIGGLPGLRISGVHLFMGTQILDAEILLEQYQRALAIARRVALQIGRPLRSIDLGGGWGTPYFPNERCLDLNRLETVLQQVQQEMSSDAMLSDAVAMVEPGRFLVNESGLYLSRVTRVKESRGKTFAVIDGGMHHHLAASGNLGQTIKRNFPVAIVNKLNCDASIPTEVVGPLCTPLDTLARGAVLPPVVAGDVLGVFQSGAYGRTSSPHGFLSHAAPPEVLVRGGKSWLIRRRGEAMDCLADQPQGSNAGGNVDV